MSYKISIYKLAKKIKMPTHLLIKKLNLINIKKKKKDFLSLEEKKKILDFLKNESKNIENNKIILRPPIVTIMGHVNHGKTSLLDYIRKTNVTSTELGKITQHIGAYHVKTKLGIITFLDTPGHEAFAAMRVKGVKITDIIVLLIAADDGVMPQTKEVISHAKFSKVPLIIAINKIDKIGINIEKIHKDLIKENIIPEQYGGNSPFINISVKTGEGINLLLENILLQAEILELKTSISSPAKGIIIESKIEKGKGPTATIILKSGILKIGDIILAGSTYGKIKSIINENFKKLTKIGPSIPVEIHGLINIPNIGDKILVIENEKLAKKKSFSNFKKNKNIKLSKNFTQNQENFLEKNKKNQDFFFIIKTNSQGSIEAITKTIENIFIEKTNINIIYATVGEITENDINLAITSKANIITFNIKTNILINKLAKRNNINIYNYNIIYNLIDGIKNLIFKNKTKFKIKKKIGLAEIKQIFCINKINHIAGCYIIKGKIKKDSFIKIIRKNNIIWSGELKTLKRFKNDVNEIKYGLECGLSFKNFNDIKVNDILKIYEKNK